MKTANDLLDAAAKELLAKRESGYYSAKLNEVPAGPRLLAQDQETQTAVVNTALDRLMDLEVQIAEYRLENAKKPSLTGWPSLWNPRCVLVETLRGLLHRALPLDEATLTRLLQWPVRASRLIDSNAYPLPGLAAAAENFAKTNEVGGPLRTALENLIAGLHRGSSDQGPPQGRGPLAGLARGWADDHHRNRRSLVRRRAGRPGEDEREGEQGLERLADLLPDRRAGEVLEALAEGSSAASRRCDLRRPQGPPVALVSFGGQVAATQPIEWQNPWEPDYDNLIIPSHVDLLRGLVWCCGMKEDAKARPRAVGPAGEWATYRKIPGKGPRLVSLGNACMTALGMMPGLPPIGQLAILKVKVKFGTAQKEIDKAFTTAAAREGLAREEIEELAVPSYGLEEVGLLRETFGDYQAELLVDGSAAALHWLKDGKPLKSVPAAVKKEHPEPFKELQASVKDVNAMLPAQRERIDTLLLVQKTWPLAIWKERYLDHPLIGTIARRLIWSFTASRPREPSGARKQGPARLAGPTQSGFWHDNGLVGANGKPLSLEGATAVSLWHPIDRPTDEILRWRDRLDRWEVVQPFKQAHREVYLLTEAERRTATYSNRFAAHILRQHQFNALCAGPRLEEQAAAHGR